MPRATWTPGPAVRTTISRVSTDGRNPPADQPDSSGETQLSGETHELTDAEARPDSEPKAEASDRKKTIMGHRRSPAFLAIVSRPGHPQIGSLPPRPSRTSRR